MIVQMAYSELEQAIEKYKITLDIFPDNGESPPEIDIKQAIDILVTRERIHNIISNHSSIAGEITRENLLQLQELDQKLKNNKSAIVPHLKELIPIFNPDSKNWWWYFKPTPNKLEKWDWLLNGISTSFLTISLGLLGDISSRLLSGGTDILGTVFVSVQSILTLLTASGALTKTGKEAGKKLLHKNNIPEQYWQEIGTALSGLLMLSLFAVRLGLLPILATQYTNWGWRNYEQGNLVRAERDYKRALSLNPENALTNFRLGLLYEDVQRLRDAQNFYHLAIQEDNQSAINNLARLYILDDDYSSAVTLIIGIQATFRVQGLSFNKDTEFTLRKNLGWVRLKQKDYNEARKELNEAFRLLPQTDAQNLERADIYCLLAQMKDIDQQDSTSDWEQCVANANPIYPEEDQWQREGKKRLSEIYSK